MGHSFLLLWVVINISSRLLMIIPVMVLLSSFVRRLVLRRLSKQNLSSNKGRRSKWFIRGGKYYGRYDEAGRNPGPFAKYLQECGIDAL